MTLTITLFKIGTLTICKMLILARVLKGGEYDNDDKISDKSDIHIYLEGPLGS